MLTETLIKLFTRDLNALKTEIQLYKKEANLWLINGKIKNSAGNLCLHIVGNLNAYIGENLGHSGYVRQRDLEFTQKNVPRAELLRQVDDAIKIVEQTLHKLTPEDLQKEFIWRTFKEKTTIEYFLVHLVMHLSYHLGQINYHRRLLD
ncbi:DUF1572 domain-containing protein [Flavobacteriaceae bacterium AU392]|nr:DinB family protein [Flavobacteriaceae bacterium]RKM85835.1 DUF1572 domain-containing protein [Flavobacteriaceae bacterium AU392]